MAFAAVCWSAALPAQELRGRYFTPRQRDPIDQPAPNQGPDRSAEGGLGHGKTPFACDRRDAREPVILAGTEGSLVAHRRIVARPVSVNGSVSDCRQDSLLQAAQSSNSGSSWG